jgi:hypothetical protein
MIEAPRIQNPSKKPRVLWVLPLPTTNVAAMAAAMIPYVMMAIVGIHNVGAKKRTNASTENDLPGRTTVVHPAGSLGTLALAVRGCAVGVRIIAVPTGVIRIPV